MIVYHHTDMDGKSAGWIVHKLKSEYFKDTPESYIMTNYEDNFDKHDIRDDVFIVDISFTEKTYYKLKAICNSARSVTWIDHHASSEEVVNNHRDELQSYDNLTYFVSTCACGAALTYAYFKAEIDKHRNMCKYNIKADYKYNKNKDASINITITNIDDNGKAYNFTSAIIPLPIWLFHVDDFDSWKKLDPDTEGFKYGFDSYDTAIKKFDRNRGVWYFNPFWNNFNCVTFHKALIEEGKPIARHSHSENFRNLKNKFEWNFKGITFICMNTTKLSSETFEGLMKKYTAAIAFRYNGGLDIWNYSVYSDEKTSGFDCRKFCEEFGGGGHKNAAGFSSKKLIFTDPDFCKDNKPKEEKERIIFLGGSCNENLNWRESFIYLWKRYLNRDEYSSLKYIELFNPVVDEWTEDDRLKEDAIKKTSMMNIFLITPPEPGKYSYYSVAEAIECANTLDNTTVFIAYNRLNDLDGSIKSLDAVGKIIESKNGIYINSTDMQFIVKSVMDALIK